jgi:hypothetical protein
MSDFTDLSFNQLMEEHFGALKPQQSETQFYLWFDLFGKILTMSNQTQEEMKDESFINISKEQFLELQDVNLNNFIVDKETETIVDISASYGNNNSKLNKIDPTLWNKDRLVTLQFDKETRTLKVKVNTMLPNKRKLWVVPKGNYMIVLAELELHSAVEEDIHIKEYKNIDSIEIVTESDLNIFTAFKEL